VRNAGKYFRMEALTEGERRCYINCESFARFASSLPSRRANTAFLNLIVQEQLIRNQRVM